MTDSTSMKRSSSKNGGRKLRPSSVFVRIRPAAEDGGHADDTKVAKWLDSWTTRNVTLADAREKVVYDFPKQVLVPEVTQDEVYDAMMPDFVDAFISLPGHNVLFFAYGQTGTGKTHTMFGADASLQSATPHKDWGIFPRVVDSVFKTLNPRATAGEIEFILLASAVEFYLGGVWDLMDDHAACEVDSMERQPVGQVKRQLRKTEDLMDFLSDVQKHRTARSTRMNKAKDEHGGSSRSHCAIMLSLLQVEKSSGNFCETFFALVDLAGAERPDKTGEERKSGMMALYELMMGKEVSIGTQGFIINYELSELAGEVIKATDGHKKGHYKVPQSMLGPAVQFLGSFLDGSAMLGMVVCLSQARSCGWETWFSLQYGTDLSKLKAPALPRKVVKLPKAVEHAKEELAKVTALLAKTPEKGSPASKYYKMRVVMKRQWQQQAELLEQLLQKTIAGSNAGSASTAAAAMPQEST